MTLDPQMAALLETLRAMPRLETLSPQEVRAATAGLSVAAPADPAMRVEDRRIATPEGHLPLRIYRSHRQCAGLIVYYHAGGWVTGNLDSPDPALRTFAQLTECCIVSVDYRLAPENPFPAAVLDAKYALDWTAASMVELAGGTVPLLVAGESAGGTLATVAAILARDRGGPVLAGQMLLYPVTAADFETPSYIECAEGYFLTRDLMRWFWNHYAPDERQRKDFRASPLLADDLSGLPPTLIQTAEYDPLRDEGEAYCRRLEDAGVATTLQRRTGLVHGYIGMTQAVRAARHAVEDAVAWIKRTTAAPG